jgi:hypothetical protein
MFKDGSPMQKPVVQRRALDFSCEGHYDPVTVMYSVNVTWDISNQHPLVREALLANRFRVDTFKFSVFPLDHGFMEVIHQFPQENETEVTALTLPPFVGCIVFADVSE